MVVTKNPDKEQQDKLMLGQHTVQPTKTRPVVGQVLPGRYERSTKGYVQADRYPNYLNRLAPRTNVAHSGRHRSNEMQFLPINQGVIWIKYGDLNSSFTAASVVLNQVIAASTLGYD